MAAVLPCLPLKKTAGFSPLFFLWCQKYETRYMLWRVMPETIHSRPKISTYAILSQAAMGNKMFIYVTWDR